MVVKRYGKVYSMVTHNSYSVLPKVPACMVYGKLKRMTVEEFNRHEEEKNKGIEKPKAYVKKKVRRLHEYI